MDGRAKMMNRTERHEGKTMQEKVPVLLHNFSLRACDVDCNNRWKLSSILLMGQEMGEMHSTNWGFAHEDMVKRGNFFILTRIEINVIRYPVFKQKLYGETWSNRPKRTIFPRYYRFSDEDGNEMVTLSTLWMICDIQTRQILTWQQSGGDFPENLMHPEPLLSPKKIPSPQGEGTMANRRVFYSDLDYNRHMNNARYADWVCDVLPMSALAERRIGNFKINFLAEMSAGQEADMTLYEYEDQFVVEGSRTEDQQRTFRASGEWMR